MRLKSSFLAAATMLLVAGEAIPQSLAAPRPCMLADTGVVRGKLAGIVTHASTGVPAPGVSTVLEWILGGDEQRKTGATETLTDPAGRFWFCEVPAGARLNLEAYGPDQRIAAAELVMPDSFARRDLTLERNRAEAGVLAVRLLDIETKRPIDGAVFRLPAIERSTLTGQQGQARISTLPQGRYRYEVEHIAYGVQRGQIEVRSAQTHALEIRIAPRALELEPITVTVEFRPHWLVKQGFYQRKEMGLGFYLSPEDIERRSPSRFSHLVEMAPGVEVLRVCRPDCYRVLSMDITRHRMCSPEVYLDGKKLRLPQTFALDDVPVWDVAAVELYTGISETPAEFYGLCGSLVIWTKRRRG